MFLAIETSQRIGSVALRTKDGAIHVEYLSGQYARGADGVGQEARDSGRRSSEDLIPTIDRLLARLDAEPTVLKTVAVSIGPGGFTGLRIAVTTAKMLAETLTAKIIAVPTALVAAENFAPTTMAQGLQAAPCPFPEGTRLLVALSVKRETYWATIVRREAGAWTIDGEPGIEAAGVNLEGLASMLADEHLPMPLRRRCEAAGIPVVPPCFDASAALRVGERLVADGAPFADPLRLLPLYPRQPQAVAIWEQRQTKPRH